MSDFDAVLERLLNEPSFASALAADPDTTLSGYRLDAGEIELLRSQVSPDTGGGLAAVEARTTKSSTFGLFSSFAEVGHTLSAPTVTDAALGPWSEFGSAAGVAAQHAADVAGQHGAAQGLGDAPDAWGGGGGDASSQSAPGARSGFGAAPDSDTDLDGLPPTRSGLGDAPQSGLGGPSPVGSEPEHLAPPKGYHPRIDADGDGHWDKATYIGTKGHGVEIEVDLNHDGHADFIGHDTNSDGRVEFADYDKDHDGKFEKTIYDDSGDGWLDRTVWHEH